MSADGTVSTRAFRPRRARWVGYPLAALVMASMIAMSVALTVDPEATWTPLDTISALLFGVVVAGGLVRLVGVRALVTREALVVRNVVFTRRVDWDGIVGVRFGGAGPWLTLDTDDGENIPVMAVQRADGKAAEDEAMRLARLVDQRSPRPPRD